MGLDMYLYRRHYVKNWNSDDKTWSITVTYNGDTLDTSQLDISKIAHIDEEVAYWRKANQIHAWFVDNAQEGLDDCKLYYVGADQLAELLKAVEQVLADHSRAPELLPVRPGFFFGNYDYDEWYFQQLEDTAKMIAPLIASDHGPGLDGFYYQSSW